MRAGLMCAVSVATSAALHIVSASSHAMKLEIRDPSHSVSPRPNLKALWSGKSKLGGAESAPQTHFPPVPASYSYDANGKFGAASLR